MPNKTIKVRDSINQKDISIPYAEGNQLIYNIYEAIGLYSIEIEGVAFKDITGDILASMRHIIFRNCSFSNVDFSNIRFVNCRFIGCKFSKKDENKWLEKEGVIVDSIKQKPILRPTNTEIESSYHCKVIALPNKSFVKIKWTCGFCHKEWCEIYRRDQVVPKMFSVPNCGKFVCNECNSTYSLRDKFMGCRVYGYHGTVHKYTTPIDATNTTIIGLEMEFEGDFYGWKELQDAHQGLLHYGYDSSVIGQNELSWDCGSYSWWKYLAPLKNVCEVLGKFGGRAGDSAGIHIHTSRPDVNMSNVTEKINEFGMKKDGRALFEAICLRNNKERFNLYSNLDSSCSAHHAGISYNSYGTCEFRLFNSTLDYKTILKHIKFCKEVFNAFADKKNVWKSFSKETISHIKECAKVQYSKGFITEEQFNLINKKLG